MKLTKKITSIATILATVITCLTLIMLLFEVKLFKDFNLAVLTQRTFDQQSLLHSPQFSIISFTHAES